MASKRCINRKLQRICDRKIEYPNRVVAGQALYHVRKKMNDYSLTIYKCQKGNHYHIGHRNTPMEWIIKEMNS